MNTPGDGGSPPSAATATVSTWTLLRTLWREEVRLHATLFGGGRFFAFPLIVLFLTATGGIALSITGIDPETVIIGLRGLVFAFGLYAGTAGLVGSDAMESLLGDLTLLLSTPETLPLSPRRLLGLFLVKDAGFYLAVFLGPLAVGSIPLFATGGTISLAFLEAGRLWLETAALFTLGMVLTVCAIAARTRGIPGWLAATTGVALFVIAALTPLGRLLVVSPTWPVIGATLLSAVALGAIAIAGYDPTFRPPERMATARFSTLAVRVPGDGTGLVAKTLLELARSSGGLWKPVVSAGLLLAVVGGLLHLVETIVGVRPATGLFFGPVLALSAFTTYNWLTQFDSLATYQLLPIRVEQVFAAKRRAFAIVGLPTGLLAYTVALVVFPTTVLDAVGGGVLFVGYALYLYGLTVFLGGFDPNEFLFDASRFASFGLGVAIVLLPAVIASFLPNAGRAAPSISIMLAAATVLGISGVILAKRAGTKWDRVTRNG